MAISQHLIKMLKADYQTIIENGIPREHAYNALAVLELRKISSGIETLELMIEGLSTENNSDK